LLVTDVNFCSPSDVKNSPLLSEIRPATIPVAAGEIEFWRRRADVPQLMRDAVNAGLDKADQERGNTQSQRHRRPPGRAAQDDVFFCDAFEQSGYLTLWETEMDKNPWQYDLALMQRAGGAGDLRIIAAA
jgi:hypothetical protein